MLVKRNLYAVKYLNAHKLFEIRRCRIQNKVQFPRRSHTVMNIYSADNAAKGEALTKLGIQLESLTPLILNIVLK